VRSRLGLTGPFLMAVGNFSPHKNIALLLDAWAVLRAEGVEGTLLLVGEGRGSAAIRARIDALGLSDSVRSPGRVLDEELPALYRETAGLLQPSLCEGFGLPVVEAMVSGAPVVVSDRGSLPEVVGDTAPVLDPADLAAWAVEMRGLLTDGGLRRRQRERSLARARRFTPEETTDRLLDLLEGLARRGIAPEGSREDLIS
jgi:glycosyltransferase involved in cell wall biosynthesis